MSLAYLLLDGACIEHLPARLLAIDSTLNLASLYATTAYAELNHCGPWLVRVDPLSPLARVFQQEWQGTSGLWLESDAPLPQLLGHLRSLVHARVENAETVLLRFYDPRIAQLWLTELGSVERDRIMGPVQLIRWSRGHGVAHEVRRPPAESPAISYTPTPWLTLSLAQLERLSRPQIEAFDRKLIAHVQCFFTPMLDETGGMRWAADCRASAARFGLASEADVLGWASLYSEFGADFPDAAGQQIYRALLTQPGLAPAQRLDNALFEQMRQSFLNQETRP